MSNIQTAPHPSPLPRGERDGVRGLKFRSLRFWSLFDYWCLEFGYYHTGLWFSFQFDDFTLGKRFSFQTQYGPYNFSRFCRSSDRLSKYQFHSPLRLFP